MPSHQGTLRVFNFRVLIPHYSIPNYRPGHLRAIQHHRHAPPSPRHTATPEHQCASHRSSVYSANPHSTRFHQIPIMGPQPSPTHPHGQPHSAAIPTTQPGRPTANWTLTRRRHRHVRIRQYYSNRQQHCPSTDSLSESSHNNLRSYNNGTSHSDHPNQLIINQQQFSYFSQPRSLPNQQYNECHDEPERVENSRARLLLHSGTVHED